MVFFYFDLWFQLILTKIKKNSIQNDGYCDLRTILGCNTLKVFTQVTGNDQVTLIIALFQLQSISMQVRVKSNWHRFNLAILNRSVGEMHMTVTVNTIGNTITDPARMKNPSMHQPPSKSTTLPLNKQNQSNQHHPPTKIRLNFKFFNKNCICTIHRYFTTEIVNDSKDNNREINANTISTLKSHENILIFDNVSYVYINFQPNYLRPTHSVINCSLQYPPIF